MKYLKIITFLCVVILSAAVLSAAKNKDKEIPPWMEDIKLKGRSTYLVPKGAKREFIGAQIVVEPPNEYVARRLYEIEQSLEERFARIEKKQKEIKTGLEELKKALSNAKNDQKGLEDQASQE